ncbi:MAG: hypothetical protein K9N49_07075, partial [Candidatus Marinimicrobia bacterium]|nr:hypothetical protein [Candidatus Neomarinimicrobiota bacterium]
MKWNQIAMMGLLSTALTLQADAGRVESGVWKLADGTEMIDGLAVAEVPRDSLVGDLVEGLHAPLDLAPGVYRVRAEVKAEPVMSMGYRLLLTVRPTDGRVVPPPQNRQASDELTPRRHEMWLATDQKRAFQHDAGGWVALEAELVLTVPEACQIAAGWKLG